MDNDKITRVTIIFADGRKYELCDKDVDDFFSLFKNKDQLMLLGLAFTPNLDGGLNWQRVY